ncbi:uncharacterized protein N7503_002865 [Penicillium pulvis]|uniref:uncharacterized protein n=1 Tax=Penicillium pulvis TaxID=1562058 RepID=UPI002547C9C9|nr:uncharacterized protein N7503_002865 [Penicillium pulvis]KAJ5810647.1 hypothetical protein N7503_002865 [Penicillium pulvis]
MPVRRAKSCVTCRRAKARCSLSTPCSRCATRSLACQYATTVPPLEDRWPRGFRPIRPATDTTVTGTTVENTMDKASDTNFAAPGAGSATTMDNKTRSFSMHIHEEAEIPTRPETRTGTRPDMIDSSNLNEPFDVSEPPIMAPILHYPQTTDFPTVPDIISPRLLSLDLSMVFPGLVMPNLMDFNLGTEVLEPQLSQRSRSLQQGSMTAKMIFSRMSEYGRMMADAKTLPPFILPPCCLGSGDQCSPNEAHTCLPEALAKFAEELYDLGTWASNMDQSCPSRSHWVFVESLRRVGCLLYLIDLLLRVDTQTPSTGDCAEFFDMPLPCSREMWQPISDKDWTKRYQEDAETRKQKGRQGLTLGMLLLIRQSAACGEDITISARKGLAEELAEWCERADDLSMLLWMGLTVEGDGQSQLYQVGTSPALM